MAKLVVGLCRPLRPYFQVLGSRANGNAGLQ